MSVEGSWSRVKGFVLRVLVLENKTMAVYAITYTLNSPGQNYEALHAYIKGHDWARVGTSSYLIVSQQAPSTISAAVKSLLDANDHHYVIAVHKPYSGFGPKDVNDWLESRLI